MNKILFILIILTLTMCKAPEGDHMPSPASGTAYILLDYTEGQEYDVSFDRVESAAHKNGINLTELQVMPIRDQSFSTFDLVDLTSHNDAHGSSYLEKLNAQDATNLGTKKLSTIVQGYNSKYSGTELKKSSIVSPLCDCLKKSNSDDIVFIFSDILENDFGINYRNMKEEDIVDHLNSVCKSDTKIIAIVQAFREQDDANIRKVIPAFEKAFKNFNYTTSL